MSEAAVRAGIAALLQTTVLPVPAQRVQGGSVNECYRFEISTGSIFVKVAAAEALDQFEAEAAGIGELAAAKSLRVPKAIAVGAVGEHSFLILEWLKLSSGNNDGREFGTLLAAQHRVTKPLFGFKRHNYIGTTRQINFWSKSWVNFWREHRFEAQLVLAEQKGADDEFIERAALFSTLIDAFFASHTPVASLLHGDLWSGNYGCDINGVPVVFDPAVYYGDRECDLAMTRLFGGFSPDFYAGYEATWPLETGWQQRTVLYNLYHVLNHFNLFGGGYLSQARSMVETLLAELGH